MLYVVTASHNRKRITSEFAQRLAEADYQDFILVLVDDGSTDETDDAVKSILNDRVVVLKGNGNLWWGGALHLAYKWLCQHANDDDIILISNDDVKYSKDYIGKGVELLSETEDTLLLGLAYSDRTGTLYDAPIEWDASIAEGKKREKSPWIGNCSSTRSLFFRLEDMKRIGGFHPIVLPHYLSDYEWTIRACRKGFRIVSDDRLKYTMSEEETGNRDRKKITFKQLFSKKSNMNPVYRFSFIVLTVPFYSWGKALLRQITRM